jgi:hypothetical protein
MERNKMKKSLAESWRSHSVISFRIFLGRQLGDANLSDIQSQLHGIDRSAKGGSRQPAGGRKECQGTNQKENSAPFPHCSSAASLFSVTAEC